MKTLDDVAKRLLGKAQNEADCEIKFGKGSQRGIVARYNMLLFIEMAEVINKHIAECPQCKPLQSR